MRRAGDRAILCPICFVEPLAGNEMALGYDLTTAPTARYLEMAANTGQMVATNQFHLRQGTGPQLGVVLILPVFPYGAGPSGTDAIRPIGFLQCVFHVKDLLEQASGGAEGSDLDLLFVDQAEAN